MQLYGLKTSYICVSICSVSTIFRGRNFQNQEQTGCCLTAHAKSVMKDIEKQAFFTVSTAFLPVKFKRTSTLVAENRAEHSIAHLPEGPETVGRETNEPSFLP